MNDILTVGITVIDIFTVGIIVIDIFTYIYTAGIVVREMWYALADILMTDIYTTEIFTAMTLDLHMQALRTT